MSSPSDMTNIDNCTFNKMQAEIVGLLYQRVNEAEYTKEQAEQKQLNDELKRRAEYVCGP